MIERIVNDADRGRGAYERGLGLIGVELDHRHGHVKPGRWLSYFMVGLRRDRFCTSTESRPAEHHQQSNSAIFRELGYFSADYHQQYLANTTCGYCGLDGCAVTYTPNGVSKDPEG